MANRVESRRVLLERLIKPCPAEQQPPAVTSAPQPPLSGQVIDSADRARKVLRGVSNREPRVRSASTVDEPSLLQDVDHAAGDRLNELRRHGQREANGGLDDEAVGDEASLVGEWDVAGVVLEVEEVAGDQAAALLSW